MFLDFIRTIDLPLENRLSLKSNDRLHVAGWSSTEEVSTQPQTLMSTSIPYQQIEVCQEFYKLYSITDRNSICAGGNNSLIQSCKGDAGAPLFSRGTSKSPPIQYGILNSGPSFCGGSFRGVTPPSIYTKVENYIDWIHDNMY